MAFLRRILGREQPSPSRQEDAPPCPHVALVTHWDNLDDIGKPDRVSRYICQACNAEFSGEEGQRLLAEEAQRVRLLAEEAQRVGLLQSEPPKG